MARTSTDVSSGQRAPAEESSVRRSRKRASKSIAISAAQVVASFIGAAIIWDLLRLIGILPAEYFPEFWTIVQELVGDLASGLSGDLLPATGQTLTTWALGFLIASAIGVSIGILVGTSAYAAATLAPLLRFARATPAVALIPAAILIAGIGVTAKLIIVVFAGVWPVLLNTAGGVRHIPPQYRDTGRAVGLPQWQMVTSVVLPTISPSVVTGLRVSMALTLAVTIGADLLIGDSGLGALIARNQAVGNLTAAYAGILWAGLLGTFLNLLLVAVERRLLFWSPEFRVNAS